MKTEVFTLSVIVHHILWSLEWRNSDEMHAHISSKGDVTENVFENLDITPNPLWEGRKEGRKDRTFST